MLPEKVPVPPHVKTHKRDGSCPEEQREVDGLKTTVSAVVDRVRMHGEAWTIPPVHNMEPVGVCRLALIILKIPLFRRRM